MQREQIKAGRAVRGLERTSAAQVIEKVWCLTEPKRSIIPPELSALTLPAKRTSATLFVLSYVIKHGACGLTKT